MITSTQISIAEIDEYSKRYAKARAEVHQAITDLQDEVSKIERQHSAKIKRLAAVAQSLGNDLRAAVTDSPALFVKPKTFVLHGITVGYRKGSGKIDWDDDETVVARIKKHFPDLVDTLIIKKEKPSAEGLETLDVKDLARIGARMESTGDTVIVKAGDKAIDKLIKSILKEGSTPVEG